MMVYNGYEVSIFAQDGDLLNVVINGLYYIIDYVDMVECKVIMCY